MLTMLHSLTLASTDRLFTKRLYWFVKYEHISLNYSNLLMDITWSQTASTCFMKCISWNSCNNTRIFILRWQKSPRCYVARCRRSVLSCQLRVNIVLCCLRSNEAAVPWYHVSVINRSPFYLFFLPNKK